MLCNECKKRESCKALCREAEQYVSQDHVEGDELLYLPTDVLEYITHILDHQEVVNNPVFGVREWHLIEKCGLTERQKICIKKYFFDGFTQEQVAKMLGINRSAVTRHIEAAKQKIVTKLPIDKGEKIP